MAASKHTVFSLSQWSTLVPLGGPLFIFSVGLLAPQGVFLFLALKNVKSLCFVLIDQLVV